MRVFSLLGVFFYVTFFILLFPVFAIIFNKAYRACILTIMHAVDGERITVRVRTRTVKRVYATRFAEEMLSSMSVESVEGEIFTA